MEREISFSLILVGAPRTQQRREEEEEENGDLSFFNPL